MSGSIIRTIAGVGIVVLGGRLCLAQTIQNASFEDNASAPVGWTAFGAGASDLDVRVRTVPTFAVAQAPDGYRIFGAVKDGARTSGGLYQRVAGTTPGVIYQAAVRIFTHRTGNGEMTCGLGVDPTGGLDPDSANVCWFEAIHSDNTWTRIALKVTAQSTGLTIFLTYHQSGTSGFAINYFDQVELIANPPPPPPCPDVPSFVTFSLSDRRIDLNEEVEAQYTVPPGYVITGLGARGSDENVSRMRVRQQRLLPDGSLGEPQEIRVGYDPIGGLEANITLPDCYVAVGYGARAAGEFDIMTLALFARPILADGTLGPVEEFRAGYDAYNPDLERRFMTGANRVLTGVGMRMRFSDITNIWAQTDLYSISGIPGDCDEDGDVDQEDFGWLQACLTGSGLGPPGSGCPVADLDRDDDVDATDADLFILCMSGPDKPGDPACLE